jgi:hypothetical protein
MCQKVKAQNRKDLYYFFSKENLAEDDIRLKRDLHKRKKKLN